MNARESRWMEYLDDELGADERDELERRLAAESSERELLESVRERRARVRRLLGRSEVTVPDSEAFRRRVKAAAAAGAGAGAHTDARAGAAEGEERTGPAASGRLPTARAPSGLARAAVIVLLLGGAAGAAAAVPGSPVRAWLAELRGGGAGAPAEPADEVVPTAAAGAEEVGVRVRPEGGRLIVSVEGAAEGAEIRVRLVDGGRAAVYGAPGTRFRTSDGRVEASVAAGPVRIEIPRDLPEAVVRVDGRVYLEKRGGRVETPGPAAPEGTGVDDFLFRAGGA